MKNRNITDRKFFTPTLSDLHDPYLMPDMENAVKRILEARQKKERVVIFGDYDVDGVSSTAILFRFFKEIGIEVSYRLPHRVHDGYGLKNYFFDELAEKNVKLVVTVDCGTRDIGPIQHAKSLGIDVIVTDHHAVPENIPKEVIAILNPKRKDSLYPFPSLAGAGVAFKLLHGILIALGKLGEYTDSMRDALLIRYIDFASLGTVADCMPLIGENRIITALGLKQMKQSESSALRKYIENLDTDIEGDADVIGFQIGPRINAAGRMDSPLKALHWLLANEDRVDDWLEEVEGLNMKRQEAVKVFSEDALMNVASENPILFYVHEHLEHGLIGLVAGKLTEAYGKPSIVLCHQHEKPQGGEEKKREYERNGIPHSQSKDIPSDTPHVEYLIASCRSPEWCNLVELLDHSKDFFVRYGGHRQAAGFTIEKSKFADFQKHIESEFLKRYDISSLPSKNISVECSILPRDIHLASFATLDIFRPFGIGNPKPLFLLEDITIKEVKEIGKDKNHLSLLFHEISDIKCLLWNYKEVFLDSTEEENGNKKSNSLENRPDPSSSFPAPGDILSLIVSLEKNIWNGRESAQIMIKNIVK